MFKNTASQKIQLFAFDATTGVAKTGDAANLTAYVSIDYGTVTVLGDTSATELDATNAPGWYMFDLTQAETNGNDLLFTAKSSTANIKVVGRPVCTVPASFQAQVAQTGDSFPRIGAPAGASVSADVAAIKAVLPSALGANGNIKADVRDFNGTAGAFASGRPEVNTTHIAGTAWASTTLFTLASHDPGATLGTSTLTQSQVTGGAYALNSASFAFNAALDLTTAQKASVNAEADTALSDVGLTSTVTGRIDVATSTRLASASYTTPPTSAANADAVWDEILSGHVISGSAGEALAASGGAGDPWITALPGSYTAGQAGYIVGTFIDAAVSTRLASAGYTAPLSAAGTRTALGLASANLDTQLDALPTATENADALLNRDMSAVSDTNARSPLNALRHIRNKWSLSGTTLTVTKEDDSTTAWTATMTTNASADPITGSDPA